MNGILSECCTWKFGSLRILYVSRCRSSNFIPGFPWLPLCTKQILCHVFQNWHERCMNIKSLSVSLQHESKAILSCLQYEYLSLKWSYPISIPFWRATWSIVDFPWLSFLLLWAAECTCWPTFVEPPKVNLFHSFQQMIPRRLPHETPFGLYPNCGRKNF